MDTHHDTLRVLIVDDDRTTRNGLEQLIGREGFSVSSAGSLQKARVELRRMRPDVVLLDLVLTDGEVGLDLLDDPRLDPSETSVIVITGQGGAEQALQAGKRGAVKFFQKPVDVERLKKTLADLKRIHSYRRSEPSVRDDHGGIIGSSPEMREILEVVAKVAPTEASVLIVGESGTGKELIAEAIHRQSTRRDGEFIAVNCGAIPPNLTESHLFGHEKGSFTGAASIHAGYFEQADGGTLFLDEVTEMPLEVQTKLLRSIESGTVRRLGGKFDRTVDVRILAATNQNPRLAVRKRKFRKDLFYRLNVFPLRLPPLRSRGDDIILIARHILDSLNENGKHVKKISKEAIECLRSHFWPGNVRELKNVMLRAYILADNEITLDEIVLDEVEQSTRVEDDSVIVKVGTTVADMEKALILATLEKTKGVKKEAARLLGISVKTLYNRLNSYDDRNMVP